MQVWFEKGQESRTQEPYFRENIQTFEGFSYPQHLLLFLVAMPLNTWFRAAITNWFYDEMDIILRIRFNE